MFYLQLAINGAVQGLIIGLGALSLTLAFGVARFPNAATGDYMTLGAFGAYAGYSTTGSLIAACTCAAFMTAIYATAMHVAVFRRLVNRPVVALLIASIGVGFLLRSILGVVFGHSQKVIQVPLTRPLNLLGVKVNPLDLQLVAIALIALCLVFFILNFTSVGRRMRAVADDRDLARVSGINPEKVMLVMWVFAGAVAGVAGMMLGIKTVVTPEMGWEMLLPVFAAAILGGIGSPMGAITAGLILGVVQELSTPFVGFTYKIALTFVVLLAVLLLRPRGLFGKIEGVR